MTGPVHHDHAPMQCHPDCPRWPHRPQPLRDALERLLAVAIAGDGGPDTDDWTCSCGLTRPVTGSYGCADCGDGRPDSWERLTHPWEKHDDSCECHIGICMECGCTNEYASPFEVAAPRAEGLDVERLAEAITNVYIAPSGSRLMDAENVAAEYARLSRPSDERVPESEEPR